MTGGWLTMKINIIAVGRINENYIKTGMNNYIERMKRFSEVNLYEVKSEKGKENMTGAQIEKVKEIIKR